MAARITQDTLDSYKKDGAVCLRGVFSSDWVDLVREGIAANLATPSEYSEALGGSGPAASQGVYFNDYCNWRRIAQLSRFVLRSPAAEIAAGLMQSDDCTFYHEHVLTKDAGALRVTPWHQDQAYYPLDGDQVCSIWMPVDPVSRETTLEFVAGSHKWNKWYTPRKFATNKEYMREVPLQSSEEKVFHDIHTLDVGKERIIGWEVDPGDCVVFHMKTIHGAPANTTSTQRRVLATRWCGGDAKCATRPWVVSPPITGGLLPGQKFSCDTFPLVWTKASGLLSQ